MSMGTLILFESTLSFLGLGIQPPAASWGNMLTGAQDLLHIGTGHDAGGDEAQQGPDRQREHRHERDRAPVQAVFHPARPERGKRVDCPQHSEEPRGEHQAHQRRGEDHDRMLGQEVAKLAPSPGTERGAHGELPLHVQGPHQDEVRQVRDRDEDDAADDRREDQVMRPGRFAVPGPERLGRANASAGARRCTLA